MVERTDQVEAAVGQRKTFAMTQQRSRQLHARNAVDNFGLDRHEMFRIELVRHLEQRTVAMALLAVGIVQCPRGVTGECLDLRRRLIDLELRTDEITDGKCERKLTVLQIPGRKRCKVDVRRNRRRDAVAVQRRRDIGLDGAGDVALHEQPLAVVERRQPVVPAAQLSNRRRDTKQGTDEILKRPCQLDQEVRFVLGGELVRRGSRRHQTGMNPGVDIQQPCGEYGIDAAETVAVVEIVEAEPVGERGDQPRRVHCHISR